MRASPTAPALVFPIAVERGDRSEEEGRLALEVLGHFERSRSSLLRYLESIGLTAADGEEVVQETFLALFEHLRRGRPETHLRGWLFRVAHNLGLKRRKTTKRTTSVADASVFDQLVDPCPNPEQQMTTRQRRRHLLAVFHALSDQDRCCLHLRAEGLRYREIASTLGISLGSVAQSMARGLERLQRADRRF
jgi:RNA polymerase sigma-70 factor (ECF subfamily)